MSEQGNQDDITVIIGDDEVSQNVSDDSSEDSFVIKIKNKQQTIRDRMLKLQGQMELLEELLMDHIIEQFENNEISDEDE